MLCRTYTFTPEWDELLEYLWTRCDEEFGIPLLMGTAEGV